MLQLLLLEWPCTGGRTAIWAYSDILMLNRSVQSATLHALMRYWCSHMMLYSQHFVLPMLFSDNSVVLASGSEAIIPGQES